MKINYFKVAGTGLGRAEHCFPFSDAALDRVTAFAQASKLAAQVGGRVVSFLYTAEASWTVGLNPRNVLS
jgi:hypothetical protein